MTEDLKTHAELTADGWEWMTNCHRVEVHGIMTDLLFQPGSADYIQGLPKPGVYSGEELKDMGMMGIYTRGGKRVEVSYQPLPANPGSVIHPPEHTSPRIGHPGDKPMFEVSC